MRIFLLVLFCAVAWVAWRAYVARGGEAGGDEGAESLPVAVEAAAVGSGVIRDSLTLTGTLEAAVRFDVASTVGGRIEALLVELGDELERDQVVAELEDEEFVHALAEAQAAVAVEEARRDLVRIAAELAERDRDRFESLRERGVASESEYDAIVTRLATTRGELPLAEAEVRRAEANVDLARLRLADTKVRARWSGQVEKTLVSVRHQDAGSNVQAGDPIVSAVGLDPLIVALSVTERDYARVRIGQGATLRADAYPDREFEARVVRIAPAFRAEIRQARLELQVDNPEGLLKPGLFVRARLVLREAEAETIVPQAALVRRQGEAFVFVVEPDGERVRHVTVAVGIVEGDRAEVTGEGIVGRVVTLGQQLLVDGSRVFVVEADEAAPAVREAARAERTP